MEPDSCDENASSRGTDRRMQMNLCDIETIRAVLGRHGFHFSKSLGQNFLTDESVTRRIAEMGGAAEAGGPAAKRS